MPLTGFKRVLRMSVTEFECFICHHWNIKVFRMPLTEYKTVLHMSLTEYKRLLHMPLTEYKTLRLMSLTEY